MSKISDDIREAFSKADSRRDSGLKTPWNVIRFDNIYYGSSLNWQVLDVYRPKNARGHVLPVIVNVHGGAWVYGKKETYQHYCMHLALRGFAVINFSYRLAPEHKFPCQLEDINTVFHWVFKHQREYGFNTRNIFAIGDSAGAHLLGLYCDICSNPYYAREYSFTVPKKFIPSAICLNCGIYNFDNAENNPRTMELMGELLPEQGTGPELLKISVDKYITENFPQTFLMTCSDDHLKEQAKYMTIKLVNENVPFEFHFYGTNKNPLGHVFELNIRSHAAIKVTDSQCIFFKRFIK